MNTYGYVGGNPVNAIDPTGLLKIHGNWCGPNWTEGYSQPWDDLTDKQKSTTKDPVDAVDSCCQIHDQCHAQCRSDFPCDSDERELCYKQCDRRLYKCSKGTGIKGIKPFLIEDYMRKSTPGSGRDAPYCDC